MAFVVFVFGCRVQRSMIEILKHLDPARWDAHVICKEEGALTEALRQMQVAVDLARNLRRRISPRDFRAYWELRAIFRREKFAVVHTHSSKTGFLGRLAARAVNVPVVVHHVRGFAFHEFSPPWERAIFGQAEKMAACWTDLVIFVNHEEREMSVRKGWVSAEKAITIYNGVDFDRRDLSLRENLRSAFRQRWDIAPGGDVPALPERSL